MGEMEGVNHNVRRRHYEARDKEDLIRKIIYLHKSGYSQVDIAKKLKLNRGTIKRWNDELSFIKPRTPGEAGKLKNKIHKYDENFFNEIKTPNQAYILGYITGDGTIFDRGKSKRLVLSLAEEDKQLIYDIAKEFNMLMLKSILQFLKSNGFAKNVNSIIEKQGCSDLYVSSINDVRLIAKEMYKYGDIKLDRKYKKFTSLMI